jgi:hypothetical protein
LAYQPAPESLPPETAQTTDNKKMWLILGAAGLGLVVLMATMKKKKPK